MRTLLQAGGQGVAHGIRTQWRRRFDRAGRRRTYQEFQQRVVRARLRTTLATQLQTLMVNAVIPLGGVHGALVGVLDHSVDDMTDVLTAWLSVRDLARNEMAEAADELVLSLAGLLSHPDPGWWQPVRRRRTRALAATSTDRFDAALSAFLRLVEADTARTRALRKAARQVRSSH